MSIRSRLFGRRSQPTTHSIPPPAIDTITNIFIDRLKAELISSTVQIDQLQFLLAQAPMLDAPLPGGPNARNRLAASSTAFASIHPKTLAPFVIDRPPNNVYRFSGSFTVYVLSSLMPEGRVLYSPLQIPGLEKTLAA